MYQPTLGRFLSRDPLSVNGVDVLTDTGYYAGRLAAMRANPWYYGGNWENPYAYANNSPSTWVDPSGLIGIFLGGAGQTDDGKVTMSVLSVAYRNAMVNGPAYFVPTPKPAVN